jgi:hypothetical protein
VIAIVRNYMFMSVALRHDRIMMMRVLDACIRSRSTWRIPLQGNRFYAVRITTAEESHTSRATTALHVSRRGVLTLHGKHRQLVATNDDSLTAAEEATQ